MPKKILIVDDYLENRELISLLLKKSGFEMITAGNGLEGIESAKEHLPEMIFMDIQMPVMDGIEAARFLKSDPLTSHIPIIAFTSYAMKGEQERIMGTGDFEGYIAKPIKIEEVQDIIEKLKGGTND